MTEVRWHGRGGQGSFTAARLLGLAAAIHDGRHALAFPSFGPERRGAPVLGYTRIDERPIHDRSAVVECDYVVVLDETLIEEGIVHGLRSAGAVLVNSPRPVSSWACLSGRRVTALDGTGLAMATIGRSISNTAMLGALVAISGIVRLESAVKAVESELRPALAARNVALLRRAYELVAEGHS